jgi:hypothetical protein
LVTLSVAVRNARLAAVAAALDAAAEGGLLRLYTAPRPAPGEALVEQVMLAEVRLAKPCTVSLAGGVLAFAPLPRALCVRSGQAAWARLLDGDGRMVMDLDAGLPGSDAELQLDRLELLAGGALDWVLAELVE